MHSSFGHRHALLRGDLTHDTAGSSLEWGCHTSTLLEITDELPLRGARSLGTEPAGEGQRWNEAVQAREGDAAVEKRLEEWQTRAGDTKGRLNHRPVDGWSEDV